MLASMNAEQVLGMGKDDMARAKQLQTCVLGLTLLAGGEFSYSHLRHLGFWPLELMMQSAWRLAGLLATAVFPGSALWTAPLALAVLATVVWILAPRRNRRRIAAATPRGGNHE